MPAPAPARAAVDRPPRPAAAPRPPFPRTRGARRDTLDSTADATAAIVCTYQRIISTNNTVHFYLIEEPTVWSYIAKEFISKSEIIKIGFCDVRRIPKKKYRRLRRLNCASHQGRTKGVASTVAFPNQIGSPCIPVHPATDKTARCEFVPNLFSFPLYFFHLLKSISGIFE